MFNKLGKKFITCI